MRVRAWPVIVIVGVALLAFAVMFREQIWDATGHDPGERLVYRFDGYMTPEIMIEARKLVVERLAPIPHRVEIDGQRLVIEVEHRADLLEVYSRLDATLKVMPKLELSVLDYDPEYFKQVRPRLVGNKRAKELGVELKLDRVGYHLEATTAGMYVNSTWADAHGCSAKDRLTGTGVYCTVTGADRITAVLDGDPGLFAEPLGVPLPADRALVLGARNGVTQAYVVERAPIVLETAMLQSAHMEGDQLIVMLNRRGFDTLAARTTDPATEVVHLVGGVPHEAKLGDRGRLAISTNGTDARTFINDLAWAHMPHRLREVPTK